MSAEIIINAISLTCGLLWEKFRDYAAEKLKEGDLTDEKCRQLIMRELVDIKAKIDGLARKDLLTSISFLEEGLCHLNISIDKRNSNHCGDSVLNEAWPFMLSQATSKLKIISQDRFTSAKRLFKKSNTKATEAFSNLALSTEDRILATKLRVISKILESLEDPDAAADICKLYHTKLHDVPAVKELFSVYMSAKMKSRFNKTKRIENVVSVTVINLVVFNFIKIFTKKSLYLFKWSTIDLGAGQPCNPLFMGETISCKLGELGVPTALNANIVIPEEINQSVVATISVNSEGEIIAVTKQGNSYNVIKITAGEVQVLCSLPQEDVEVPGFEILSLTIDGEDNIYVMTTCILFVFDAKGSMKYNSTLEFLNGQGRRTIAVTKDKNIFIHEEHGEHVHVCDSNGQLKYRFPLGKFFEVYLSISDENEVIVAPRWGSFVYIYTDEGKLKRKFEVPQYHKVDGVAFNYVTKEVIVVSTKNDTDFYLSIYSKTGQRQQAFTSPYHSLLRGYRDIVISHPSGPVDLVYQNRVLFLQK